MMPAIVFKVQLYKGLHICMSTTMNGNAVVNCGLRKTCYKVLIFIGHMKTVLWRNFKISRVFKNLF